MYRVNCACDSTMKVTATINRSKIFFMEYRYFLPTTNLENTNY